MSSRPAVLLLLLALLSALWHPLCPCGPASTDRRASEATSCCAEAEAPRPVDPCGKPAGECECEQGAVLARAGVERTSVELANVELALALSVAAPRFEPALAPAPAPRLHVRTLPPGAARLLPLRI